MKTGRNDPCHCGSGKKYKKCHLAKDPNQSRAEKTLTTLPEWVGFYTTTLSSAAEPIAADLESLPAAVSTVFGEATPKNVFADTPFGQHVLFDLNGGSGSAISQVSVSNDDAGARQKALCTVLAGTHPSIWEVVAAKRGKGIRLLDRLAGGDRWLADPALAETLEPMEMIHARVATVDKNNLLLAGWEKLSFHHRNPVIDGLKSSLDAAGFEADDRKGRVLWTKAKGAEILAACRAAGQ